MRRLLPSLLVIGVLSGCVQADPVPRRVDDDASVGAADGCTGDGCADHDTSAAKDCGGCDGSDVCDPVSGLCAQCVLPSDCDAIGGRCILGRCRDAIPCKTDTACEAVGGVCDGGQCTGCKANSDCKGGRLCRSGACVPVPEACDNIVDCGKWHCDLALSSCVQCMTAADCDEAHHCKGGYCVTDVCAPGQSRCKAENPGSRWLCAADGAVEIETPCATGATCHAGVCKLASCEPDKATCDGHVRATCSANGRQKIPDQDCGLQGKTCVAGKCVDYLCTPGHKSCDGDWLRTCNATGTKEASTPCGFGQTCVSGQCKTTTCTPLQLLCQGDEVRQCDPTGTTTTAVQDCKADSKICDKGSCKAPICQTGDLQCDDAGKVVHVCGNKGLDWMTYKACTASTPFCVAGKCVNKACKKGESKCVSASVWTCADDELSWQKVPCGGGKVCVSNKCSTPACTLPSKWDTNVQKMIGFALAKANEGCDLDGDGKPDNELAASSIVGGFLLGQLGGTADLATLLRAPAYSSKGSSFSIEQHTGGLDPGNKACAHNSTTGNCKYRVNASGLDVTKSGGQCPAKLTIPNAKVNGTAWTANGGTLNFPMFDGAATLSVQQLTWSGTVNSGTTWTQTSNGMVCGAVVLADLVAAIDSAPDSAFTQTGFDKATFKMFVELLLDTDLDTDGDGKKDAASAAFTFSTAAGSVVGVQ